MFRAPPGRVFVQADEAQIEYRILAALAGAKRLINLFARGEDAHIDMCHFVYGPIFDTFPPLTQKRLRTIVKRVVYALSYGANPPRITQNLREDRKMPLDVRTLVTLSRVQKIWDGFFAANPEIRPFRKGLLRCVEQTGYLEIPPLGRRRYFPLPADRNKVFNWPIQTLASDIVNLALTRIDARLPPNALTLVHAHDAGLWECDEADGEKVKSIVEEEMAYTLNGPGGAVQLFAEGEIVHAWYEGSEWPSSMPELAAA